MKKYIIIIGFFLLLFPLKIMAIQDTSKSSIVMDINSGRILYEKNSNQKRLIASTTKIMTAIVTIENVDINKKVVVGNEVLSMYGTNIYIEVGEEIKIIDLLYGLLLRSGNDASETLAIVVSGSEKKFVELMNSKAKEIGMKNTIFKNPHGLDEKTQNYSTAADMARLSKYASQNKIYKKITSTKKRTVSTGKKTYLWYNRNKLLNSYSNCTGGKNGYTPSAGKTLITTATKDHLNLTIVTLNDPNEYQTHRSLYELMFSKYKSYTIIDKNNFYIDKAFYDGEIYIKKSFTYPLTDDELNMINTKVEIIKKAVTSKNARVGKILIFLDNKKIGSIPIYKK